MLLELREGLDDFLVLRVALDIDKEKILPRLPLRGAALDFAHVQLEPLERLQSIEERARAVLHAKHQRGFVGSGRRAGVVADDEEARRVVRAILDRGLENLQPIDLRSHAAGERAGIGLGGGKFGGARCARDFDAIDARQIVPQPLPALPEDLRMGINLPDFFARDFREEVVLDAEEDLRADFQLGIHEHIEGVIHRALGGILDRGDPEVGFPALHGVEYFADADLRRVLDACAEFLPSCLMRPRRFRAEIGDGEVLLQRE